MSVDCSALRCGASPTFEALAWWADAAASAPSRASGYFGVPRAATTAATATSGNRRPTAGSTRRPSMARVHVIANQKGSTPTWTRSKAEQNAPRARARPGRRRRRARPLRAGSGLPAPRNHSYMGRVSGKPHAVDEPRRLYRRHTLVLRDGVVQHVFYPVFPPDQHAEQVLGWLPTTRVGIEQRRPPAHPPAASPPATRPAARHTRLGPTRSRADWCPCHQRIAFGARQSNEFTATSPDQRCSLRRRRATQRVTTARTGGVLCRSAHRRGLGVLARVDVGVDAYLPTVSAVDGSSSLGNGSDASRAARVTVLDRLVAAGISEDRARSWIHGEGVRVDGQSVIDPAHPASPPARITLHP